MNGVSQPVRGRLTTIWEEKRVIFICFIIGFSQFQYGYDAAAVAGFQSMPGFLRIFGYPDVSYHLIIPCFSKAFFLVPKI